MSDDVESLIAKTAERLRSFLDARERTKPVMIGVMTGGVWVAERLHSLLEVEEPLGALNIHFYRDDFSRIGIHPRVHPSSLPCAVDDRHVVLVDDVFYTGRTVRAALNEIFDYGRPASVTLAVLVDRGERELPVQPDVVGTQVQLPTGASVKLTGPSPLQLVYHHAS